MALKDWIPEADGSGPFFGVARAEIDSAARETGRMLSMVHWGDCPPGCDHPLHKPQPPRKYTLRQRLRFFRYRTAERIGTWLIQIGRNIGGLE